MTKSQTEGKKEKQNFNHLRFKKKVRQFFRPMSGKYDFDVWERYISGGYTSTEDSSYAKGWNDAITKINKEL